jgi:hypothetical protein
LAFTTTFTRAGQSKDSWWGSIRYRKLVQLTAGLRAEQHRRPIKDYWADPEGAYLAAAWLAERRTALPLWRLHPGGRRLLRERLLAIRKTAGALKKCIRKRRAMRKLNGALA